MNGQPVSSPPQHPDAGFWLRVGAKLIDHGLWSFVEITCIGLGAYINAVGGPPWIIAAGPVASMILWYLYLYRLTLTRGQTVGKIVAGVQVVDAQGNPLPPEAVLRRVLIEALFDLGSVVLMGLGWMLGMSVAPDRASSYAAAGFALGSVAGLADPLWVAFHARKRALHDLAGDTFVVKLRHAPATAWVSAVACLVAWLALPFFVMRPFIVESYVVPSGSMEPTIQIGDRILANKLMMRLRAPRHDEIIMFRAPTWVDPRQQMFVKRVIGVAGDALSVREGKLYRNGTAVEEPFIAEPMQYTWPETGQDAHEINVPEGSLVVLGDNRNDSNDSHRWERISPDGKRVEEAPFLPVRNVKGRLIFRFWPPDRMGTVAQEEYAQ